MSEVLTDATPTARAAHPEPIDLPALWPWLLLAAALLLQLYIVGVDQGATALTSGQFLHELVHDGRHLLGVPCH